MASAIASAASAPMRDTSLFSIAAGREREHHIAVAHCVRGIDRPRQTVMRHLRDLGRLHFRQPRVGGNDADGRVLPDLVCGRRTPARKSLRASAKPFPSGASAPATTAPVPGSMTSPTALTATIAATTRLTLGPAGTAIDAVPMPPFIAAAAHFADRGACTSANVALGHIAVACGHGRPIAAVGRRPDVGPAAYTKIENNRARHDWHFCNPRLESNLPLVKILAYPGRDIEPERAAA